MFYVMIRLYRTKETIGIAKISLESDCTIGKMNIYHKDTRGVSVCSISKSEFETYKEFGFPIFSWCAGVIGVSYSLILFDPEYYHIQGNRTVVRKNDPLMMTEGSVQYDEPM